VTLELARGERADAVGAHRSKLTRIGDVRHVHTSTAPNIARAVGRRILYWIAVLVVSLALLVALVLLLESRDAGSVGALSLANTTIRLDAL
jgi:hypothetical protein